MQSNKWFLQSKTIISTIIILLIQIGPMLGLSFSADDGALLSDSYDSIATTIAGVIAMYGRVKASSSLTVGFSSSRNTTNSPAFIPILALLLLGACGFLGFGDDGSEKLTAQTQFYQVKAQYVVATEEAAAYASLPFCDGVTIVVGCSSPGLVIKLADASTRANAAFAQAEPFIILLDPNAVITAAKQDDVLNTATVALRQLTAVLALAVVAEGSRT
jgi:hypothetical protein